MAGKKGRSGRTARFQERKITDLLNKYWPEKDREAVIKALCKSAKEGNERSAALLLAYAYGKPAEKHVHAGDDNSPIILKVVYAGDK